MNRTIVVLLLFAGFVALLYLWVRRRRLNGDSTDHYGGSSWVTWGDTEASNRYGHQGDSSHHGGSDSVGHSSGFDGGSDGGGDGGSD